MALFLLCPNLGWIQGQFNFTELSLRYHFVQFREICAQQDQGRVYGTKQAVEVNFSKPYDRNYTLSYFYKV